LLKVRAPPSDLYSVAAAAVAFGPVPARAIPVAPLTSRQLGEGKIAVADEIPSNDHQKLAKLQGMSTFVTGHAAAIGISTNRASAFADLVGVFQTADPSVSIGGHRWQ
jgi:hypothetical protein